jgi:hypothetical protein
MRSIAIGLALALLGFTTSALAASPCPPEVAEAKARLSQAQAALKKTPVKDQGVQGPRTAAAARGQDVQAPRGQDLQAPRGQDLQAPRGQDLQAPRGQDLQAPRGQDIQAPRGQDVQASRVAKGASLVREAEQACKKGNMKLASEKAKAALTLLNQS